MGVNMLPRANGLACKADYLAVAVHRLTLTDVTCRHFVTGRNQSRNCHRFFLDHRAGHKLFERDNNIVGRIEPYDTSRHRRGGWGGRVGNIQRHGTTPTFLRVKAGRA